MTKTRHPALEPRPYLASVFTRKTKLKYNALILLWVIAALWFWLWWLEPGHVLSWPRYIMVTLALAWIWAMQLFFAVVFLNSKKSVAPDPVPGQWRVAMITTKTPAEPFAIVRATLEGMLAQDYPHDNWLADEDPDQETLDWCQQNGVRVISRKGIAAYHRKTWPRRTRCKEGNLAYFYDQVGYDHYDIVCQLDSDHVPQDHYLTEMLRPFLDPHVGYVSAPSICESNAKHSWAARTRLYSEAAFHGVFQLGYTAILTPMSIGSHYAVRTKALKAAGGLGPELAEDHSTTMLISANGWRGVHAIDAIAIGQGPETLADLVTQEFQWSRSLLTLLLEHTPRYLPKLPWRLRFLFMLCQTWYVFFAASMLLLYVIPIFALALDIRYANVTYPAFIGHAMPAVIVMIITALCMRRDHFFRPSQAKVISWEKILFVAVQWPWVLWGCVMAVWTKLTGGFVDFRITPKGASADAGLPFKVIAIYVLLALGAILPVIVVENVQAARGFYILSLFNALMYLTILMVAIVPRPTLRPALRPTLSPALRLRFTGLRPAAIGQYGAVAIVTILFAFAFMMRSGQSFQALATGIEDTRLAKAQYTVSGAGMGGAKRGHIRIVPDWGLFQ